MTTKLKSIAVLRTRAAVEAVINEIVSAQIEREGFVAIRDAELLDINNRHNPRIDDLAADIETNLALVEQWASANRKEEFADAQSILINAHRVGFRLGNPKVEPAGKLKLPGILKLILKKGGELLKKYVREKKELNKEALLETGRLTESPDEKIRTDAATELADLGIEITQDESFYLEPNRAGQAETTLKREAA